MYSQERASAHIEIESDEMEMPAAVAADQPFAHGAEEKSKPHTFQTPDRKDRAQKKREGIRHPPKTLSPMPRIQTKAETRHERGLEWQPTIKISQC